MSNLLRTPPPRPRRPSGSAPEPSTSQLESPYSIAAPSLRHICADVPQVPLSTAQYGTPDTILMELGSGLTPRSTRRNMTHGGVDVTQSADSSTEGSFRCSSQISMPPVPDSWNYQPDPERDSPRVPEQSFQGEARSQVTDVPRESPGDIPEPLLLQQTPATLTTSDVAPAAVSTPAIAPGPAPALAPSPTPETAMGTSRLRDLLVQQSVDEEEIPEPQYVIIVDSGTSSARDFIAQAKADPEPEPVVTTEPQPTPQRPKQQTSDGRLRVPATLSQLPQSYRVPWQAPCLVTPPYDPDIAEGTLAPDVRTLVPETLWFAFGVRTEGSDDEVCLIMTQSNSAAQKGMATAWWPLSRIELDSNPNHFESRFLRDSDVAAAFQHPAPPATGRRSLGQGTPARLMPTSYIPQHYPGQPLMVTVAGKSVAEWPRLVLFVNDSTARNIAHLQKLISALDRKTGRAH